MAPRAPAGPKTAWRERARDLKLEISALALAYGDPRTPAIARIAALGVAGYALSPIDLIPDPIPILGYLDDLLLLPLGVWIALRLIPAEVMADARARVRSGDIPPLGSHRLAGTVIVALWIISVAIAVWLTLRWL
jgi:uncharacterized membrane protein YkvA (DUF1232 family)